MNEASRFIVNSFHRDSPDGYAGTIRRNDIVGVAIVNLPADARAVPDDPAMVHGGASSAVAGNADSGPDPTGKGAGAVI